MNTNPKGPNKNLLLNVFIGEQVIQNEIYVRMIKYGCSRYMKNYQTHFHQTQCFGNYYPFGLTDKV